jgi:hypothetical protein
MALALLYLRHSHTENILSGGYDDASYSGTSYG